MSSSGICKNEVKEKKKERSSSFNLWIYFGIIILALIFIILIILLIYSIVSNKQSQPSPSYIEPNIYEHNYKTNIITSPAPIYNDDKKTFLSNLLTSTSENTNNALKSVVNPLYDRRIQYNRGGYRCINRSIFK